MKQLHYNILSKSVNIWHKNLLSKEWNLGALNYLTKRGITKNTIKKFKLGFCRNNITYNKFAPDFTYSSKELHDCGIFNTDKNCDLFNDRITIPIIYKKEVKYVTSRSLSPNKVHKYIHQHGHIEYAFNHDALDLSQIIFITEGPFDCMTLDQFGIPAIGLLGLNLISRTIITKLYDKDVYIVFDTDKNQSGQNGAIKLANKLASYNIKSRIITLPLDGDKTDVNSFFETHTIEEFQKLISQSTLFNQIVPQKNTRKIPSNIPIIQEASKYITIQKCGSRYKAICPFHDDTNASLIFYENTNSFYCFGCGKGGNTENFIKLIKNHDYKIRR